MRTPVFPLLTVSEAAAERPTVPQWVATVFLLAALAVVIAITVFFIRAVKNNRGKRF